MVLIFVLGSIGMGVVGQMLLKMGAHTLVLSPSDLMKNLLSRTTIVALVLYVGATLLWITALSRAPLSYVYPLLGLSYVLVVLMSHVVFHETVSVHRWIGVCVIMIGFIVVATS